MTSLSESLIGAWKWSLSTQTPTPEARLAWEKSKSAPIYFQVSLGQEASQSSLGLSKIC